MLGAHSPKVSKGFVPIDARGWIRSFRTFESTIASGFEVSSKGLAYQPCSRRVRRAKGMLSVRRTPRIRGIGFHGLELEGVRKRIDIEAAGYRVACPAEAWIPDTKPIDLIGCDAGALAITEELTRIQWGDLA